MALAVPAMSVGIIAARALNIDTAAALATLSGCCIIFGVRAAKAEASAAAFSLECTTVALLKSTAIAMPKHRTGAPRAKIMETFPPDVWRKR